MLGGLEQGEAMTTELHKSMVSKFVAKGFKTGGFWKAMRARFPGADGADMDLRAHGRFVPDAWMITDDGAVILAEVGVTHPLSLRAFGEYIWFWFEMDCEGVDVVLFSMNSGGVCAVDLRSAYYAKLSKEAGRVDKLPEFRPDSFYTDMEGRHYHYPTVEWLKSEGFGDAEWSVDGEDFKRLGTTGLVVASYLENPEHE